MKKFATFQEYHNSSNNEVCYNSLYVTSGAEKQVYRVPGQDWSRRKMIALIASLGLHDFLIDVDEASEKKILRLFKKNGYVPSAYHQEGKSKDFLFIRK